MQKETILTGDRPTGSLHLGHYTGSLENRVRLQTQHQQFVLIADLQALTDHAHEPEMVRENVLEVALDYLGVGIDPAHSTICLQSMIPELADLSFFYMNLVSVGRLERNPTVKSEIKAKGFEKNIPVGFQTYPISQAADISAFKATLVPVGDDQLPMIELTNEIVRKFNRTYKPVLVKTRQLLGKVSRLPGTDGNPKMGKSLGNAVFLKDGADTITKKVMKMYTDPNHIRVSDSGTVEGNPVFSFLDAFGKEEEKIADLKAHYQRGGLGDVTIKKYLNEVLQEFLRPIRAKREEYEKAPDHVMQLIKTGTDKAREVTSQTLSEVKSAMALSFY